MRKILFSWMILLLVTTAGWAADDIGLAVGVQAPDFEATTHDGGQIKLSEAIAQGPAVLVFYRGGWCMYCNRQLQELQARLDEFEALDAQIIAVSVDRQEKAAESVDENGLGFVVVSDPEASLLQAYNIVYQVPDDLAAKYKNEYDIDLEAASGRDDHVIAIPAVFIVDQAGEIVYAFADKDYKIRADTDQVLDKLQELSQATE